LVRWRSKTTRACSTGPISSRSSIAIDTGNSIKSLAMAAKTSRLRSARLRGSGGLRLRHNMHLTGPAGATCRQKVRPHSRLGCSGSSKNNRWSKHRLSPVPNPKAAAQAASHPRIPFAPPEARSSPVWQPLPFGTPATRSGGPVPEISHTPPQAVQVSAADQ